MGGEVGHECGVGPEKHVTAGVLVGVVSVAAGRRRRALGAGRLQIKGVFKGLGYMALPW
jgi:hypothetical protein